VQARFAVGQLIRHQLFNYRGVIIDVDPCFMLSDEWYEQMALTRPPRDEPWYRVLVDQAVHETYVAERNLLTDDSGEPVRHPELDQYFREFRDGAYVPERHTN
jgi:heat shock protein HspQ